MRPTIIHLCIIKVIFIIECMLFDHNFRCKSEQAKMKTRNEIIQNVKNYNIHKTINIGIQIKGNFAAFSMVVVKILYLYY